MDGHPEVRRESPSESSDHPFSAKPATILLALAYRLRETSDSNLSPSVRNLVRDDTLSGSTDETADWALAAWLPFSSTRVQDRLRGPHIGKVGCLPAPRGHTWIAAVAVTRPIGRFPSGASPAGGPRLSTPASGAGPAATSSGTCRQVLPPAAAPADDVRPPVPPEVWTVLGVA